MPESADTTTNVTKNSSAQSQPIAPHPPPEGATSDQCPVGDKARAVWLSQQSLAAAGGSSIETPSRPKPPSTQPSTDAAAATALGRVREVSSIPRADDSNTSYSEHTLASANSISRNWIYPSEEMFFAAMKRKSYDPSAADMRTIVPIHNAVNERAWAEIKQWESGRGSEKCGGPKLTSFSGDSKKMTPKAKLMVLLGYQAPFDRHDWVVDRCGKKIEYVIDFYAGKRNKKKPEMVSFYLDVRPKLSFEGALMRLQRWMGGLLE